MSTRSAVTKKPEVRRAQRLQAGREARNIVNRKQLGQVHSKTRKFDPVKVLLKSDKGRVASLLPVKYSRMALSPFSFFRGAVSIMAADLAAEAHTGLHVQLCGDAHVQNLGSFEGPDGRLVFDINDFDETISGPWEWDLKRMAASLVLAGYESNHGRSTCTQAIETFAGSYCNLLEQLAEEPLLVAARYQIRRLRKNAAVSSALSQAERANPCDLLKKYTQPTKSNGVMFKKLPNLLWRVVGKEKQRVLAALPLYREALAPERLHFFDCFQIQDVGFKVVGTGSVGLRDYVVLMFGNGENDPLFLQIKEEVESAYAPYLNHRYPHQGQRVAEGQRKVQPQSDLLLAWTTIDKQGYLVRQLNDHKAGVDLQQLRQEGLGALASVAGELLARGHARSGDPLQIKGYLGAPGKVIESIVGYGLEYAGQAQADFEQFTKAIQEGRIKIPK